MLSEWRACAVRRVFMSLNVTLEVSVRIYVSLLYVYLPLGQKVGRRPVPCCILAKRQWIWVQNKHMGFVYFSDVLWHHTETFFFHVWRTSYCGRRVARILCCVVEIRVRWGIVVYLISYWKNPRICLNWIWIIFYCGISCCEHYFLVWTVWYVWSKTIFLCNILKLRRYIARNGGIFNGY
jgi:hypothetical protein